MRATNRLPEPSGETGWFYALGAIASVLGVMWLLWLADRVTGGGPPAPPLNVVRLAGGQYRVSALGWALFVVAVVLLVGAVVGLWWLLRRVFGGASALDGRARFMASSRELAELEEPAARRHAERLGAGTAGAGSPLARSLRSGRMLYAAWEWVEVWIMGPRAGKSSCVCIPQVLAAPAATLCTSNKPDVVTATRGPRSEVGTTWVNDPQGLVGEPASWYWNPLSFVTSTEKADELAAIWAASSRNETARTDAYFDGAARELLSNLLLAAAFGGCDVVAVFRWLNDPDNDDPVAILREHDHLDAGLSLANTYRLSERQRDGVFGSARQMAAFLRSPSIRPWIARLGPDDVRPAFSPAAFVCSTDTLYLMSREGEGSARAITASLTQAVLDAAEADAARRPRGRLAMPLECVLDEAANICRIPDLPDKYSHYGSKGILLKTFLQSWAQGEAVWGDKGMAKLWGAANVRGVGRGVADGRFLEELSKIVGTHDRRSHTATSSRHGRTHSTTLRRENILDVADLAAMPQGRALLLVSGVRPALVRLVHWSETRDAERVLASEACYGSVA